MKTHLTISVTGDSPQVAKGVIQTPNHPNLPATGNSRSLPLALAGVLMVSLIILKASKRHAWWVLCLCFALSGPKPVNAAELIDINHTQVSTWDVIPAMPTPQFNPFWPTNNGFMGPTPDNSFLTTNVNQPVDLTAKYGRPPVTDTFKSLGVTLTIWQVSVFAGGRYQAKRVFTDTKSTDVQAFVYRFSFDFKYTPTTPGTYFLQYTTNTPISLSDPTLVATSISRLMVKQPTTTLSIQAPPVVFPSTGSPANQATAQITPIDATDQIKWVPGPNVNVEHTTGASIGFRGQTTQSINWDPNRPGLPAKLNATAGKVSAQHDFHIGGLAAVNTSLDALDRAPLRHTTQGLQATAAQLPAGRWQYDWLLIPTKKVGNVLQVDTSKQVAMKNFSGVNNASGFVDDLTDNAVAFELLPTGNLVDTLMQATSAGTAYVLQLQLTMVDRQQLYTLTSNFAGITVAKPQQPLALHVDQKADWTFTRLQLFDETPVAPNSPITVTLRDDHKPANWTLSVSLASTPSKKDFPFALLIGNAQQVDYDHPAAVIRTGKANLNAEPIDLRLKPTQEATTSLAKHWHADIVWTVAQKIDANGL